VKKLKIKKKDWEQISNTLISLAVLAVIASVWGFLYSDLILASTQWLLVAAILALFSLWAKTES